MGTSTVKHFDVYSIRKGKGGVVTMNRAGRAFQNRDGSINIYLDSLPIDGQLKLKEATQSPAAEILDEGVQS